ncbi:hypothetical protein VIGAN_01357300, partial [Vigna angularis var. angularis]
IQIKSKQQVKDLEPSKTLRKPKATTWNLDQKQWLQIHIFYAQQIKHSYWICDMKFNPSQKPSHHFYQPLHC